MSFAFTCSRRREIFYACLGIHFIIRCYFRVCFLPETFLLCDPVPDLSFRCNIDNFYVGGNSRSGFTCSHFAQVEEIYFRHYTSITTCFREYNTARSHGVSKNVGERQAKPLAVRNQDLLRRSKPISNIT